MSTPGEYGSAPEPSGIPAMPPPSAARSKVTGGQLLSAAWGVLNKDREMILLPVLASVFSVIAVIPFVATGAFFEATQQSSSPVLHWIVRVFLLFVTMFVATTIAVYFQVALVSAVYERIEGGDPTLGSALSAAWRERVRIIQWAFLSAVVGLIIKLIADRVGGIGQLIINALAGVAWTIASLFVVPIIVAQGLGPIEALKESAALITRTWGKSLRAGIRFGITQFLVTLIPFAIMLVGFAIMATGSTVGLVSGGAVAAVGVLGLVAVGVFFNALATALRAMIYRYAVGLPVPGSDTNVLAGAFQVKR